MNRRRRSATDGLALALAAVVTTWLAMWSWRGFVERPAEFLGPLLLVGLCVAGSGVLGRDRGLPGPVVVLGQGVVGAMVASWFVVGTPVPVGSGWSRLTAAFQAAVDSAQTYAAPVPAHVPEVAPLLIAGGLGAMLLVDILVSTLRWVPIAGLPLLAVSSVPVSILDQDLSWWVFVLAAGGFLVMLFLQESAQIARWGRPLDADEQTEGGIFGSATTMRGNAGAIGGLATTLALVVPLLVPTLDLAVFDLGVGDGDDSEITIENPMADLRRDLKRGDDFPLLQVRTDDPNPAYLRISVLNRFSDNQWSSGNRDVPDENTPDGAMPPPPGLDSSVPRESYDYSVSVTERFDSTWLPTQTTISAIEAAGDWRYDDDTFDFIASDDGLTTAGMSYTMTSIEPDLEAAQLAASLTSVDDVPDEVLELPSGMPDLVEELALEVTRDHRTKFAKAVALQRWFREDGGFEYDLERAPEGNGVDELEAFLAEDGRVGYCEQFAASMAVMARVVGIPSRVAVGFLRPDPVGSDVWAYSTHDLHTWPELYFEGAGWVRFEPTPGERAESVPGYTVPDLPNPEETAAPTDRAPSADESLPRQRPDRPEPLSPEAVDQGDGDEAAGFPWGRLLGGVALLALVLVLLLLPRTLRGRRREVRLAGGPEEAWEELWATATDLGLVWPDGRSPRETRDWLVQHLGSPASGGDTERPPTGRAVAPAAADALDRVLDRVERLRYAPGHESVADGDLAGDVRLVTGALEAGATRPARRRAQLWPRSVLRRPARGLAAAQEREPAGAGTVEHL